MRKLKYIDLGFVVLAGNLKKKNSSSELDSNKLVFLQI